MTELQRPIGQIKLRVKVFCKICGCGHVRNLKRFVYKNTKEEIEAVKNRLAEKSQGEYTCRVCKTIEAR